MSWPYFVSKLTCEIPVALVQTGLLWLVVYWLIGFQVPAPHIRCASPLTRFMLIQGNFLLLAVCTCLMGVVAASSAILIGACASNVMAAMQTAPLVFVPQLLFSGFFISVSEHAYYSITSCITCSSHNCTDHQDTHFLEMGSIHLFAQICDEFTHDR